MMTVGHPHGSCDINSREGDKLFFALQINIYSDEKTAQVDIDWGNPAIPIVGAIFHGFQVFYNSITGTDNTYGCFKK